MYGKILQRLLQNFFLTMGRAPITPNEWSRLRKQAMELARKEGGDPITGAGIGTPPKSLMDTTKDLPGISSLQNNPKIIPFPKQKSRNMTPLKRTMSNPGIRGLMMKGNVRLGEAPKTLKSTLDQKKAAYEGHVNKEMWVKNKIQQNKDAIERFKTKFGKKEPTTVEDFRDKGDWDPSGMAEGGIAPLVGEPSYAADFYDDRTPMKRGKRPKKKKTHKERVLEAIKKLPTHMWRMSPTGKQIYKKKSDIPKEVLEILEKDPGFDFEDFAKIYWSPEGAQWTDEGFSRGRLGSYSGMTGDIELGMAPFGKKAYKEWELGKPHLDIKAMSDSDKAVVALHELRHKNILENPELWESQPEWVKSIEGPGYLPGGGTTGHELYTRFLDKRFNPTISDPGRHDPYFDKILRDHWEPYAQEYEKTAARLKGEKRGEGIETLAAEGGRMPYAAGKLVKGGRWFLNNLKKALNDIESNQAFKTLPAERKEGLTSEIKNLIKSIEGGGPIPDEMIQTIRKDPKFAEISKTRSTDPDLYEFEEVILDYKADKQARQIVDEVFGKDHPAVKDRPHPHMEILEQFDVTKRKPNFLGGRVSYSGGGRAGLPAVTYGMSQMNMQGPQMPAAPQPQGISGANLQLNQMNLDYNKNQMMQSPYMPTGGQPYGGQLRMPFAGGGMGRRAFLKLMAGLGALPFMGRGAKKAAPVAEKITEEVIKRGPDGMPSYLPDLIEVVKMKGIRSIEEGFKKSDYSTKHSYKGVEVVERPNGTISVRTDVEGVGTDDAGEMFDGITRQMEMEIVPGEYIQKGSTVSDDAAKVVKEPDQYFEYTAKPDMDGKMKDVEEYIDDIDHEGFKEIAEEIKEIPGYPLRDKQGLASGGIARMLGE